MSHGEIIERGAHADLIAQNGEYAKMWRAQLEEKRKNEAEEGDSE